MSLEYKDVGDWEVMTPTGWQSFSGIKKTTKKQYVLLEFASGKTLKCSTGHKLKRRDGVFVNMTRLREGTKIIDSTGELDTVITKKIIFWPIDVYDLVEVENGHEYITNGLVSSNCAFVPGVEDIWLAAQNTLSCLQENSLVLTDHGLIRIGDLARPNMNIGFNDFSINVHDGNNIMPSTQFYCSPKSQLYKVKFKSGGFIVGTENHPLKTQLGWKSISGLEPTNHSVLVKYNQNLFGSEIDYSGFHKNLISVSRSDMKIVQLPNSDWAYLSGIWCAEGHFCERGIGITNTDIQIIDRLKSIGFNKIDDRHNMLHSKYAKETLMWIGCSGVAHTKRVPAKILSASRNEQIEFLRGLFDGDGCAMRSQGLKLTSVSSQLLSDVRAMLLNFGINSITRSVTWKSTKSTVIKDKSKIFHGFELTITGFDAHKFYSEIGFFLTRKQDHHKFLSKKPIKRVFPDKESVFRLIKKSGYSVAEFQKQHAVYVSRYLWVGGKGLSISTALKMLEVCDKELPEYAELQNQYNKDISEYYDQVVSIEPTDIDLSYDIKVPGSESFISNGYVNHNTGGSAIVLSCVTADTYVFDKHIGLTQISNYIDNTKIGPYEISNYSVLGKDTFRSGTLFHNNGCVDTRKISTKFSDVECSLNHKLWAYKASTKTFGWTQSKDLEVGDFLSIQYGTQQFVGNDDISSFLPTVSEKIKYPFAPTILTPDICYLLGLYISEGSAYKVKNADGKLVGGMLTISCGDAISSVFDRLGLKYYTNDELHYCVSNKNIIEFLEYIGFDLSRVAHEKIIPQRLMSISRDNMVQLLRGIFDGDGHGEAGTRVGLASTSEILIDQVRMILLNFGILSSKFYTGKEQMNSYGGKIQHNYDTHSLEIYGQNALKYFTRVGFNVKRKQSGYDKLIKSNLSRSCSHDVIPNTLDLVNSLYTASGETSRTIGQKLGIQVNGYVSKKTKYKTPNISAANVKLLYSTYKHLLPTSDIEYWDTVIDDNLSWVQIKEIIESKNQTYDFSLPDNPSDNWCHSVLYNGILGHQTPNGVGNLFHQLWSEATDGLNDFNQLNLPWQLHPERDQKWRDVQTKLLGPKGAAQECFDADTRIYTNAGFKRISDIRVGDMVLTHLGRYRPVLNIINNGEKNVVEIRSSLNRTARKVTANHPFYSIDKNWIAVDQLNSPIISYPANTEVPDKYAEIKTIDLTEHIKPTFFKLKMCNDGNSIYINDRKHKTIHNRVVALNYDVGFMVGLYLAEGWAEDNRVYFCFNWKTEKNDWPIKVLSIIDKNISPNINSSFRKTGESDSGQLMVNSQILSKLLHVLTRGTDCYDKCLSEKSYEFGSVEYFKGILDGLFIGDGMVLDKYGKKYYSASENLRYDAKYLMRLVGFGLASMYGRNIHLLGSIRKHCDARLLSSILTDEYTHRRTDSFGYLADGSEYSTIRKNEHTEPEMVYNLEVVDDHSYVTEHSVVHNCDCEFSTSGNTVIDLKLLEWYEKESKFIVDPKEKRGHDRGYWIWEYPKAGRSYMVTADVARGDAADFSACQVIDVETLEQVAEYKGQLPTKEYARILATIATEYNMALLVVENANIGWAVIQELVDMDYKNLFYSSADLLYVDVEAQMSNKIGAQEKKLVPGFTTSSKSKPLLISKLESYLREKSLIIHSKRLLEELKVFVWKNSGTIIKAEAMNGYNDDLVMSIGIAAWIRDTALRLKSQSDDLTRTILNTMGGTKKPSENKIYSTVAGNPYGINTDPWKMRVNDDISEDLTWLLE